VRRSELFFWFSLLFTLLMFAVFRTPYLLYMGLFYSLIIALEKDRLLERKVGLDAPTLLGIVLVGISPIFLLVHFGEYTSPATFHALFLLGVYIVLFDIRESLLPPLFLLFDTALAMLAKTGSFGTAVTWLSDRFVDLTSYLVRGLIDLFNVPITMSGNVAVVRDTMVVIGSGCSGLDAFTLYLLATLLLIYLRRSGRKEAALLLIGALGIIPLNAVRIFTLLVIGYHSGISFLELFHSHLGDLMFVVYVFIYWWWATGRKEK